MSGPVPQSDAGSREPLLVLQQHQQQQQSEPWIEVIEQPKSNAMRFRYVCEGRCNGKILGERSTEANITYPSIRIHNMGQPERAIVVVSCVTTKEPHHPHPHSLVGQHCDKAVCTLKLKGVDTVSMENVGIQCSKRQEVEESIHRRSEIRVDPFGTGYITDKEKIDLGAVRLCFQAFLPDANGKFTRVVKPALSQPIIDKKIMKNLVICRLSKMSSSPTGGEEVILLCEKVKKDDVEIRFYEEDEYGIVTWEAFGQFTHSDVHRQCAITFRTPPYADVKIDTPVTVFIQLRRPSNSEHGEPKEFTYTPDCSGESAQGKGLRKRRSDGNMVYDSAPEGATASVYSALSEVHKPYQPDCSSAVPVTVNRLFSTDESNSAVSFDIVDNRCPTTLPSGTFPLEQDRHTSGVSSTAAETLHDSRDSETMQPIGVAVDLSQGSIGDQEMVQFVYVDNSGQQILLHMTANGQLVLPQGLRLVPTDDSAESRADTSLADVDHVLQHQDSPTQHLELCESLER